jgi:hypothetical protein
MVLKGKSNSRHPGRREAAIRDLQDVAFERCD